MKFEDWFYENDNFGSRSKRFFYDCDLYFSENPDLKSEGEVVFLAWLRAAFENGKKT